MSDLYLDLRARIPVVAARTVIGTARIQEAQDRVGLSNERIARLIPVSERTWRRWKEAGTIPTASLGRVAEVLGMELRQGNDSPAAVRLPADDMERLHGEIADLRSMVERLLEQQQPPRRQAQP